MKTLSTKFLIQSVIVVALLSGCGKNNTTTTTVSTPAETPAPAPTVTQTVTPAPTPSPTPTMDVQFSQNCTNKMGQVLNVGGRQLCATTKYSTLVNASLSYNGYYMPRISANDIAGLQSVNVGLQAKAGDTLVFQGQAFWGQTEIKTTSLLWDWVHFSTWQSKCRIVDIVGKDMADGKTVNYLNAPAGLVVSDGVKIYPLSKASTFKIDNNGDLKIGFNVVNDTLQCSEIYVTQMYLKHCEDQAGNSYPCQ